MSDASNRQRVEAYLVEHPKASDSWIAAALHMYVRSVSRARRLIAGEKLKKPRDERMTVAEYDARRHALIHKKLERTMALFTGPDLELQAMHIAAALSIHVVQARRLLMLLEATGRLQSRRQSRKGLGVAGRGRPWRLFKLAAASQERAA